MTPDVPLPPARILYLEDDLASFEFLREWLASEEFPCELSHVADRASYAAALRRGDFDLILADFLLPDMDGFEALALKQEFQPELPFIFLSGALPEDTGIDRDRPGVTDYISKDSPHRIVPAIQRALRETDEHRHRLRAEQACHTAEEQLLLLSAAVKQSPIGIAIADRDLVLVFANEHMLRLVGGRSIDFLGRHAHAFVAPSNSPDLFATLRQGQTWQGEFMHRRLRGEDFLAQATVNPIRDAAGLITHYLCIIADITPVRREQENQRRLEQQLVQAQKMESLGTMAGGIAHDFNNILTGIIGHCELALANRQENIDDQRELHEILANGRRASDLVSKILTFSRQDQPTMAPMELSTLVEEAVSLLRASTPKTIHFDVQLAPGRIIADATRIHQVIMNLVTNAVHAMRDRLGVLALKIERLETPRHGSEPVRELATAGPCLRLTVEDNGHGISPENLARIFDPFFTTKKCGEGTGLGLAVVLGIVNSHRGAIRVESQLGRGTRFSLYFPETVALPPPDATEPEELLSGNGQRIAIIDDETTVISLGTRMLQRLGYDVIAFTDALQALHHLEKQLSPIDLVVTDQIMPACTGFTLRQRLRASGSTVPILIMTGDPAELSAQLVGATDRVALLAKPFRTETLAAALHHLLAACPAPASAS